MEAVQDLNIRETSPLAPPRQLRAEMPPDAIALDTVVEGRVEVERILSRRDDRMLAIVGPCCIHDPDAALEYARKLNQLRRELRDPLCIFMRCYFEKPRTVVGWKGLMYDPHLDGSGDLEEGLRLTRRLLLDIGRMGLPVATEMLNPITPQYTADLISWACIGARTIESQSHREMASGLSMPVGIKNSTEGNLQVAVDAIRSARQPHTFLGTDEDGRTSLVRTRGNPGTHIVLRGGGAGKTNYDAASVAAACALLRQADLEEVVVIDCSHGNSGRKHERQRAVWNDVVARRAAGRRELAGAMVESNLHEGSQKIVSGDGAQLRYGVSVIDECVGWDTTEAMLRDAAEALARGRAM